MKKGFHQRYVHESYRERQIRCENCKHLFSPWNPESWEGYCNRTGKRPKCHQELGDDNIPIGSEKYNVEMNKYREWERWRIVEQYGYCDYWS